MLLTNIDGEFLLECQNHTLKYDMTLYFPKFFIERLNSLNNSEEDGTHYTRKKAIQTIDEYDAKLCNHHIKSNTRLICNSTTTDEIINTVFFQLGIKRPTEIINFNGVHYISWNELEPLLPKEKGTFDLLKLSYIHLFEPYDEQHILSNGEVTLISVSAIRYLMNDDMYLKRNTQDIINEWKSLLEKMLFLTYEKQSDTSALFKLLKTKVDRTLRKTYVMFDSRSGLYKIGYSKDPNQREKTLQSEQPLIILLLTCDDNIESQLHETFKEKRIRGEWFKLNSTDYFEIEHIFRSKENAKLNGGCLQKLKNSIIFTKNKNNGKK